MKKRPKPSFYQPRAVKPAYELCELIARMVDAIESWKEKEMSQLTDLFDPEKERKKLAKRNNTINETEGIAIKFLLSVPGHSAGDTCIMAAAQARVYLEKNQAERYFYTA